MRVPFSPRLKNQQHMIFHSGPGRRTRQQCESKDILGNYNAGETEAATGSLDSLRGISLPKFPVVAHTQNSATPKTHAS